MQTNFLRLHTYLVAFLVIALLVTFSCVITFGTVKADSQIGWLDCFAEGGIAMVTLTWLLTTLLARPKGKVTNLLFFGLTAMLISMLLDFLDEFFRFNGDNGWVSHLEAFPAFMGMILMSFAMYHWYKEQQILNNMLSKKERFYREHGLTDFISGLYRAEYMKQHIDNELLSLKLHQRALSVALIDIKDFSQFNGRHGTARGNSLLADIGQIILLNLRDTDLACRYAGDRFIVLMPNTNLNAAQEIIKQVAKMVAQHKQYTSENNYSTFSQVHWRCVEAYNGESKAALLKRLNDELNVQKAQMV
ncbi:MULTISPECIES: GGDEF domain-containing protein [Pseudoalteromonas]|uniref:diguanylate cyclase n=1 Tax=Pseudoalteromonas amylolytica TaxID=1859457 RepID=A0A1S1MWT3_9GAMM|nr:MULTISPECIES: diguanylate cyclase [Pseudoalteromonas]OHU88087.1 diguanylate cyclase [Pseudoalteromonas sp. JW3]OHU91527.1 diguanylate cyclase [Pseudoalteromonas amylolytica]